MTTKRELIYMVMDQLKITSDDSFFNEEHIAFLLDKHRAFLLQKYANESRNKLGSSNYQTICLNLEPTEFIDGDYCKNTYLKSVEKIPSLLSIASPSIYLKDFFFSGITYVSKERMKYVCNNKWLTNIIYACLSPDSYLYLKSSNPQFLYLKKIQVKGIFEDTETAFELSNNCNEEDNNTPCDLYDAQFPIEDSLVPMLIESVVKELGSVMYSPQDKVNNSNDDLTNGQNAQSKNK